MNRKIAALFAFASALSVMSRQASAQEADIFSAPETPATPAAEPPHIDLAFGGGDAAPYAIAYGLRGKTDQLQLAGKTIDEMKKYGKELEGKTVLLGVGRGDANGLDKAVAWQLQYLQSKKVAGVILVGDREARGDTPAAVMNARYQSLALSYGAAFVDPNPDLGPMAERISTAMADAARINAIVAPVLTKDGEPAFDMIFGDSIAFGLYQTSPVKAGRSQGGMPPGVILGWLKAQKPGSLRGQRILLSSGISNGPAHMDTVREEIRLLKEAGAYVAIAGTGPRKDFESRHLNEQLEQAAKDAGFAFMGPIVDADKVKVHPWDYRIFYAQAARAFAAHYGTMHPGPAPSAKPSTPGPA